MERQRNTHTQLTQHDCIALMITGWIPARLVLYFLSWSGFMASFMMRNDINIAIVSMTKSNQTYNPVNASYALNASSIRSDNEVPNATTFDWSSGVQAWIMSSFYACYVLSQVSHIEN